MNNLVFYIITYIFAILVGYLLNNFIKKLFKPQELPNFGPIDINILDSNRDLVSKYIDKSFNETLFYYLNKDLTFDDNSVVKIQSKYKYRECIRNLMRPNVYYSNITFKNAFIQRVYLLFVSQTPKYVKDLIFSFDSGFTYDNYFDKKKKPSIQPFVFDYIDKKINKSFLEITKLEEDMFASTNVNSIEIDKMANVIDSKEYAKLCSFIYNIDDEEIENMEISNQPQKENPKSTEKEIKK